MRERTKVSLVCCVLGIVSLLAGCASRETLSAPEPSSMASYKDPATIKLAEAAASVSESLLKLAKMQAAVTPADRVTSLPAPQLPGMTDLASVDWSGPVGLLTKKVADMSGYKLRVLGSSPAIPIIVNVNATNTSLATILRDLDFQAGDRAHITAYPSKNPAMRVIELRYAKA